MAMIKRLTGSLALALIALGACRKSTEALHTGRLSLDSLSIIENTDIPQAIYTDAFFTSATTGYAISNEGMVVKTTDAGLHWVTLPVNASFYLEKIQFVNAETGFIIGGDNNGSYLFKTTNGGSSWTTIELNTPGPGIPSGMFFINSSKGFITGPKSFLKTENGGDTWTEVLPDNDDDFFDVGFRNNLGIATTVNGNYFKSTDSGTTWEKFETGAGVLARDIFFVGTDIYLRANKTLVNIVKNRPVIEFPHAVSSLVFIDDNSSIGVGQHYEGGFWPYGDIYISNNRWASSSFKKYTPDISLGFSVVARMSERKYIMIGTGHLRTTLVTITY